MAGQNQYRLPTTLMTNQDCSQIRLVKNHFHLYRVAYLSMTEGSQNILQSGLSIPYPRLCPNIQTYSTIKPQTNILTNHKYFDTKKPLFTGAFYCDCDPDRIRTCDLLIRSQLLYPAELRDQRDREITKKIYLRKFTG